MVIFHSYVAAYQRVQHMTFQQVMFLYTANQPDTLQKMTNS